MQKDSYPSYCTIFLLRSPTTLLPKSKFKWTPIRLKLDLNLGRQILYHCSIINHYTIIPRKGTA